MDYDKLIEQLNDWNEKYISNLCGDRTIKCEEYCIKDDCLIVKATTALSTLQGENEQLREERDQARTDCAVAEKNHADCAEELEKRQSLFEDVIGDMPVDRLREIVQADREGRCVVLKCKPNATVWFIKSAFSTAHFPIEGNYVSIKGVACDGDIYCSAITAYNKISRSFYMSDIGKTVFLTREEAQAALRREQDGNNK